MQPTLGLSFVALGWIAVGGTATAQAPEQAQEGAATGALEIFHAPVRLEANGAPIDIGKLSSYAHAGPAYADIDGDGDRDLLVGDFPGAFWFFENAGSDAEPRFLSRGQLEAGGKKAETPVY